MHVRNRNAKVKQKVSSQTGARHHSHLTWTGLALTFTAACLMVAGCDTTSALQRSTKIHGYLDIGYLGFGPVPGVQIGVFSQIDSLGQCAGDSMIVVTDSAGLFEFEISEGRQYWQACLGIRLTSLRWWPAYFQRGEMPKEIFLRCNHHGSYSTPECRAVHEDSLFVPRVFSVDEERGYAPVWH